VEVEGRNGTWVEVVEAGWSDWAAANTCTRPKGVIQR
jgi:hypothetical protein